MNAPYDFRRLVAAHGAPAREVLSWPGAAAAYDILINGRVPVNLSFWVLRGWINSRLVGDCSRTEVLELPANLKRVQSDAAGNSP
jgi:hypothetical protein